MAYQYVTLTQTNLDGSISPFANGASGYVLLGGGTSVLPSWSSLVDANIASLTDLQGYLPLTGGTLTGALTGTSATFTGLTISGLGTGPVKATSGALSVGNIALGSEVSGTLPVSNGGIGQTSLTANQILLGNGSNGISSIAITNDDKGKLLRYTTSGTYDWVSISSLVTIPPITSLEIGSSGLANAHQFLSKNGTNVTADTNPVWSVLTNAHIYVNANASASDGPNVLVNTGGEPTATWLGCSNGGGTGPLFIGVLPDDDNVAALDLATYAADPNHNHTITNLDSGSTDPNKVLMVGAASSYTPTWNYIKDINTGLTTAAPAKIDSNGKLTSGAIALNGSEVTNTLPVGKGGTGATSLTGILVGNGANAFSTVSLSGVSSGAFLKYNGSGYEFDTITVPSAYTSIPESDSENGAIGTAGTYAPGNHSHPLPYAVQTAYRLYYPRVIGITGAITAAAQEFDGSNDLMLVATRLDPYALEQPVPVEFGGTGASTSAQALTNLGAAASNHNHDTTYLKLSGGSGSTMTGAIYFNSALSTVIKAPGMSQGVVTVLSNGDFTSVSNVNSYVTGRRNNINLYEASISANVNLPTDINHVAKNDTVVNIVCGSGATSAYTKYINLPTPTSDMLGDTITVYFTNQAPAVTGSIFAKCSTDNRIKAFDYSNFSNTPGNTGFLNCVWSSGNVVKFTCINLENNGTTYYWRAVKLVEQTW